MGVSAKGMLTKQCRGADGQQGGGGIRSFCRPSARSRLDTAQNSGLDSSGDGGVAEAHRRQCGGGLSGQQQQRVSRGDGGEGGQGEEADLHKGGGERVGVHTLAGRERRRTCEGGWVSGDKGGRKWISTL